MKYNSKPDNIIGLYELIGGTLVLKCGLKHGKDEVIPLVVSCMSPFVHSYITPIILSGLSALV